ncbi:MAG TPA: thermonuclease family protein [Mesorhizobium sp.]|nr:thermonuclease family protein [Mesorhizobium sp.]HEV2501790.1 thermonuclease family protein [Mesorhizobium sp.]
MRRTVPGLAVAAMLAMPAVAADLTANPNPQQRGEPAVSETTTAAGIYRGRVAVMDGRTLWFPKDAAKVRLLDIDSCELPQWAFDPKWTERERIKGPPPVPCGPLAKAWLKRTIGSSIVDCAIAAHDNDGVPLARCIVKGKDLALEMLRVGWARIATPHPVDPAYLARQQHAMAARYGMWATYVLDMNAWRRKAIDTTLSRRPIADFNLLTERESEISPPFVDARRKPKRTDR